MRYPSKFLSLIDICLEKRKAIDGFYTPFVLTMNDFASTSIADEQELTEMLKTMKQDRVIVRDKLIPVLSSFAHRAGNFRITDCSTDHLKDYRSLVLSKMEQSLLMIKDHGGDRSYVHYRDLISSGQIKSTHKVILSALIDDFLNCVTFYKIQILLRRSRCLGPNESVSSKSIHNMVGRLRESLITWFPDMPHDVIQSVRGKGYILKT